MLYTGTSITLLTGRIGWDQAVPPTTLVVDASNLTSASGRFFNSFHQLVTAENVNDCVLNLKIDITNLNAYLAKMKKDSVLEVLNKLFDTNPLANYAAIGDAYSINYSNSGYDSLITDKVTVFDNAIGYAMSVRAIQLFISSERSNGVQRKMKASYDFLMAELNGIKNNEGVPIAQGANTLFAEAIEEANKILFPTNYRETKKSLTDRTYYW